MKITRIIVLALAFAGVFALGVFCGLQHPAKPAAAQAQPATNRYLMQSVASQPVDGGQAYCYVFDTVTGIMHVFVDKNYVGVGTHIQ